MISRRIQYVILLFQLKKCFPCKNICDQFVLKIQSIKFIGAQERVSNAIKCDNYFFLRYNDFGFEFLFDN